MTTFISVTIAFICATTISQVRAIETLETLAKEGCFGFPQAEATVVCDTGDLRVSIWNDASHLFVQAILWKDDSSEQGRLADGQAITDSSSVAVDIDCDRKPTEGLDRYYHLPAWPKKLGLWYQIIFDQKTTTTLKGDSRGRGGIQYVQTDARPIRVDSFVIPLDEISLKLGESVRFSYFANSTKPEFTLNSLGHRASGEYYFYDLPWGKFHRYKLEFTTSKLDVSQFPKGRGRGKALIFDKVKQ